MSKWSIAWRTGLIFALGFFAADQSERKISRQPFVLLVETGG